MLNKKLFPSYGIAIMLFWMLFISITPAHAQSVVGKWKTIDDETQKEKSIVEVYIQEGKLYGKILKLFREPGEELDPVCEECDEDDPRYMKKVIGMVIMEGLEKDNDKEWEDGKILDPKNGKVYGCNVELLSDDKLKLRGYIGFSLLGRTQYWYRVKE